MLITSLDFTTKNIEQRKYGLLPKIFLVIEELIKYGNEDVDYDITMMFLEDLISIFEHRADTISYNIFLPSLGFKSKEFCKELSHGIFEGEIYI